MKALKSSLVKQMLADPVARDQLRTFARSAVNADKLDAPSVVHLEIGGKTVVYRPVIVAKAA